MNEISNVLAKIVVDSCLFFEFSDSNIVNPDVAINMMEQIAAELQELPETEKAALFILFKEISRSYDEKFSAFILELPRSLGLID
ncbi:hypothetical protein [Xanthomonas oryzae]|uniref:hypothetical protein n=1 Tax=Xanthomonas oryzae TaxID=347 RepID=UPI0010347A4F|nr:hypothetical protein [Xanthomonas oryzae]QBH02362.1 hypothetical protein EYC57_01410 [Xanthomonas oryzae]